MPLKKPYYRIVRPKMPDRNYESDRLFSNDRIQLSRAYKSIEASLVRIFDFIEPGDANEKTFSLELYTLLLRACTEVELNLKNILNANKYNKRSKDYNMEDYFKIEKSSKLSKYEIKYCSWRANNRTRCDYVMKPFAEFGLQKPRTPFWYKGYNSVKHNRERKLELANLKNCIYAVAGLLVLLYSQFGERCIDPMGTGLIYIDDNSYAEPIIGNTIFILKAPTIGDWELSECYDFDWDSLKVQSNPIEKFDFNKV